MSGTEGDTSRARDRSAAAGIAPSVEKWETLSEEEVVDCGIFHLYRNQRRSPRNGSVGEFHTIHSADWVNIIPLTEADEVIMIQQYRHGVDRVILEIPGGILDEGENPVEAGERELIEETGWRSEDLSCIGVTDPNPALFNNRSFTLLARNCVQDTVTSFDEHEDIGVVLVPLSEIDDRIRRGEITHSLVLNAFHWLRLQNDLQQ